MALDGIIFDLDGTLVDTNDLHVEAWRRAFEQHGYNVPPDRIFIEIGKGGDHLVPDLLGKAAAEKDGNALRGAQPKEYVKIVEKQGVLVFPRVRELLQELRRRGLKLALSTSSAPEALKATQRAANLNLSELFDQIVTADDIKQSKPSVDAVAAAATKLKLAPTQLAMIGDTPYDVESAKRGGVVCLALACGGFESESLRATGARAVYKEPADLLAALDDALKLASPGAARLATSDLERLMHEAIAAAREGLAAGEVSIGAALFQGDGTPIARGYNQLNKTGNKTAHAEIVTFANAAGRVDPGRRDLILLSTLEPCVMCLGAAMEAGIDTVIFGLNAPADGGVSRVQPPTSPESQMPRIVGGILADECRKLFQDWLKENGDNREQRKFVDQLLSMTR